MHETLPSIVQKRQQGQSQHRLTGEPLLCGLVFHSSPGLCPKAQSSNAGVESITTWAFLDITSTLKWTPWQGIVAALRASSYPCLQLILSSALCICCLRASMILLKDKSTVRPHRRQVVKCIHPSCTVSSARLMIHQQGIAAT